jgi:hypothetical protein
VSREIDEIWHLWILETRSYEKLCAALHGRQFIHHASNVFARCNGEDVDGHVSDVAQEVETLANYALNYGPFQPERIKYWPFAEHLVDKCGMSVDNLNAWLASAAFPEKREIRLA